VATEHQVRIAEALGVDVSGDSESVAAARILDEVALVIGERNGRRPATEKQVEYGQRLGLKLGAESLRVAAAKIHEALRRRSVDALRTLDLKPGDRVVRRPVFEPHGEPHETAQEFVISSIQSNSRVFFKGGHGQSAWPTQLEKVDIQGSHPAHPADGVGR
jgi:hypothetical protein